MLTFLLHLFTTFFSPDNERVATVLQKQAPYYLTHEIALQHVIATKIVATDEVPAELLLSMAYVESRYTPRATSRVEGNTRKTGVPSWSELPPNVSGPYFCGVTQADARFSWERCLELRNIFVAYATTVRELTIWRRHPLCRTSEDPTRCSLWGYGGGKPAIEQETSTYPLRVMSRANALHRATSPGS